MTKKQKAAVRLKDVVEAAHAAGAKVTCILEPRERMPRRFAGDHEHVTLLLDEAERVAKLGNAWMNAEVPNPVAAETAFRNAWAHSASAAWLRCKLNGELPVKDVELSGGRKQ